MLNILVDYIMVIIKDVKASSVTYTYKNKLIVQYKYMCLKYNILSCIPRNLKKIRYADDTTMVARPREECKEMGEAMMPVR